MFEGRFTHRCLELSTSLVLILQNKSVFVTAVDQIVLPLQYISDLIISSLAIEVSRWNAGSGRSLDLSEFVPLCNSVFHGLCRKHSREDLIKTFHLLIWLISLLNSANAQTESPTHIQARKSLADLIGFLGKDIILEIEKLCEYSNIKHQSSG